MARFGERGVLGPMLAATRDLGLRLASLGLPWGRRHVLGLLIGAANC